MNTYKTNSEWSYYADKIKPFYNKSFLDLSGLKTFWNKLKTNFVSSVSEDSYLKLSTGSTKSIDIDSNKIRNGVTNTGTSLATDGYVLEKITENTSSEITETEIDEMFLPVLKEKQVYITWDDAYVLQDFRNTIVFTNIKIDAGSGFKSIDMEVPNDSRTFSEFPTEIKFFNMGNYEMTMEYPILISPSFNFIPEIVDNVDYTLTTLYGGESYGPISTGKFSILLEWKNGKWVVIG